MGAPNKCSNRWLLFSELFACASNLCYFCKLWTATDLHLIERSKARMWVSTQQWIQTRRMNWMKMKTAGKFLSNIRNMDHGSKCKTIVVIRRRKWLIVKCVALAPTRRISCWTAPLTCRASSSSTVTLARQTTGMRVSLFNWLSLNLIGHPNHALDIYLMNLSLPGLLLAAWHQARSSRLRTAGRTCSQRRVTSRRRQGQNHQFQGFRSLFRNIFRKTMKHEVECMYVSSWLQFISPGSCARRVNELVEISVEKSCVGGRFVAIISIASFWQIDSIE